jgi:hypothetical protein
MLVKPFFPIILDLLAHTFWYSQHMATVHYEHGKFHVHYEYMLEAKKSASDKGTAVRPEFSVSEHELTQPVFDFSLPKARIIKEQIPLTISLPTCFLQKDYPPPRS